QALEGGRDLVAGAITARPQPQLTPARGFEHRQLDPHLVDGRVRLPRLDPRPREAEQLRGAAERMPDDGFARFDIAVFADEAHAHLLRAGAAQAELLGEVAAQRARDEEQGLAILHRRLELPVGAREHRRLTWRQMIGLEPACELQGPSYFATMHALEHARTACRT